MDASFQKIHELIATLPPDEQHHLHTYFQQRTADEVPRWWAATLKGMDPQQLSDFLVRAFAGVGMKATEEMFTGVKNMAANIETKVKDHFIPKPRMTARDDEVERLRDQEKLTNWDEITKCIRSNPDWATDQSGKPVRKRALMAAYQRRKKKSAAE